MSWYTTFPLIDYDILLYGMLFPPCLYGENAAKIEEHPGCISHAIGYSGMTISGHYCGAIIGNAIVPGNHLAFTIGSLLCTSSFIGIYAGNTRTNLRKKYMIDGNKKNDSCHHFVCSPIALCQEAQEIRTRQNTSKVDIDTGDMYMRAPSSPTMEKI